MEYLNDEINEERSSSQTRYVRPIDPKNPFDNPTENPEYNDDYGKIVPQIAIEGCEIPHIPGKPEKKKIRYYYNIAGGGILFHLALSVIIANILSFISYAVLMQINGIRLSEFFTGGGAEISAYMSNSSIMSGITLLSYLTANIAAFFIGCKFADINVPSFFKTQNLTVPLVIQYILAGLFIQRIAGIAVTLLQQIFTTADLIGTAEVVQYTNPKVMIVSACYACIVAPFTEELLYRGFVMKTFSKVSQRFGIFASAFFFGIMHGNTAQFILAFLVGIFMGYIDIKHNSLVPSVCVHFSLNLMSVISGFMINYSENGSAAMIIYNLALIAIFAAGLVMLILFLRRNRFPKSGIHQKFRCMDIVLTSPAVIAAVVVYAVIFIAGLL